MKRFVIYLILMVLAIGIIFTGYQWYAHYKMNQQLEQMELEIEQLFQAKCGCWISHAENALDAYQNGDDSQLREIIEFRSCDETVPSQEYFGTRRSLWNIYFDHLKACEYKHTEIIETSLLKVLKPEVEAKCKTCLSLIPAMDYLSHQSTDTFRETNFLSYCYPFYEMVGQRINTPVIDAVAFVAAHDLVLDRKIVSLKRLIRKHKNYKYLTSIDGIPKMKY